MLDREPRSAKGRRTRARLIDAGKTIFERDGFLQARITDIAAEAGVSHGSFYHYFEAKELLFREIAGEMEAQLLSNSDVPSEELERREPISRIRAANRSYLEAYGAEAGIMRVIEEVCRYDDDVREIRRRRDDELADRLEKAIVRLQSDGSADTRVDPHYAAWALGGMVAKFAEQMFVARLQFDVDDAVDQLTLLWANALGLKA